MSKQGENGIVWCDETWNPVRGCTRISPGCGGPGPHGGCYAEAIAARFSGPGQPYEGLARMVGGKPRWTGKLALAESVLSQPLRWRKPRKIFVNSMSDLFHKDMPREWIDRTFAVAILSGRHTLQILTKRPDVAADYLADPDLVARLMLTPIKDHPCGKAGVLADFIDWPAWPMPHIWIGASVEDQARADERREHLRRIAALGWLTWVSYEPALGPVDWRGWEFLKWLVSGGESGPQARPSHPDWHRAARDWCAKLGIAFLFKQHGQFVPAPWKLERLPGEVDAEYMARSDAEAATHAVSPWGSLYEPPHKAWSIERAPGCEPHAGLRSVGKKAAGRLLDGVLWDQYPGGPNAS